MEPKRLNSRLLAHAHDMLVHLQIVVLLLQETIKIVSENFLNLAKSYFDNNCFLFGNKELRHRLNKLHFFEVVGDNYDIVFGSKFSKEIKCLEAIFHLGSK